MACFVVPLVQAVATSALRKWGKKDGFPGKRGLFTAVLPLFTELLHRKDRSHDIIIAEQEKRTGPRGVSTFER